MNILTEKEVLLILKKMWNEKDIDIEIGKDSLSRIVFIAKYNSISISASSTFYPKRLEDLGKAIEYSPEWNSRMIKINDKNVYYMSYIADKYLNIIFNKFLCNIAKIYNQRKRDSMRKKEEEQRKEIEHIINNL